MSTHRSATRFEDYYHATAGRPAHRTVTFALQRYAGEAACARHALDLGCGSGRDTLELLAAGFSVTALDAEPGAIEALRAQVPAAHAVHLETRCQRMEDFQWQRADLVVASFSLPLLEPPAFSRTWRSLVAALVPGGRFAGHLLGERDDWAARDAVTCLGRPGVERLLRGFEVEMLDEEESDGVTPRGSAKHWHLFHVVARRR